MESPPVALGEIVENPGQSLVPLVEELPVPLASSLRETELGPARVVIGGRTGDQARLFEAGDDAHRGRVILPDHGRERAHAAPGSRSDGEEGGCGGLSQPQGVLEALPDPVVQSGRQSTEEVRGGAPR